MANEKNVAKGILENVGGIENIKSMEHCATRLRLILKDKSLINEKEIENIDGVKGQFFAAQQYQIILGTGFVNKVFDEISANGVSQSNSVKEDAYSEMTLIQKISRTLGDIFVPIIPVLVATGLFMGLRGLITNLGVQIDPTLNTLTKVLTDTAFVFLPALVCWSTIKKFGGSPIIGLVLGLMLVSPEIPNAWNVAGGVEPIYVHILGVSLPIIGYQGSVLPALILGIIASKLEKSIRKVVPDILDLILTPFLTLLISITLGFLVVGPIMHSIESLILFLFQAFLALPFGIGGLIIGGVHQGIVVFGVHHIFNALEAQLIANTGLDPFNAIISGAIIAQGAATIAVALRTKDKKKRSLYFSSAIPAFLGITEPAIFGVNLRFVKPFAFALAGGAVSGMFASFIHLAGTGMGITVLPGLLLYLNTNILGYIITLAIGFAVSFILTFTFFKPAE